VRPACCAPSKRGVSGKCMARCACTGIQRRTIHGITDARSAVTGGIHVPREQVTATAAARQQHRSTSARLMRHGVRAGPTPAHHEHAVALRGHGARADVVAPDRFRQLRSLPEALAPQASHTLQSALCLGDAVSGRNAPCVRNAAHTRFDGHNSSAASACALRSLCAVMLNVLTS